MKRPKPKPRKPVRFRCWAVMWTRIDGVRECEVYGQRRTAAEEVGYLQASCDEDARLVRGHFVEDR